MHLREAFIFTCIWTQHGLQLSVALWCTGCPVAEVPPCSGAPGTEWNFFMSAQAFWSDGLLHVLELMVLPWHICDSAVRSSAAVIPHVQSLTLPYGFISELTPESTASCSAAPACLRASYTHAQTGTYSAQVPPSGLMATPSFLPGA